MSSAQQQEQQQEEAKKNNDGDGVVVVAVDDDDDDAKKGGGGGSAVVGSIDVDVAGVGVESRDTSSPLPLQREETAAVPAGGGEGGRRLAGVTGTGGGTPVGGISTGSMNFGIPTNRGARDHVDETHGKESWRYRVLRFLHSHTVQFFMMSLLILDVLILFVELYLLATYPHCHTIERDAISCCPASSVVVEEGEGGTTGHRFLADDHGDGHHTDDHHDYCDHYDGLVAYTEHDAGCDSHKWSNVHTAEEVLFAFTITILCTFFLELNVEMMALHPAIFFQQFFFLLDYVIVAVSLILEITFHLYSEDIIQSLVGLLVLVRIWRFVRIGHGIVEVVAELSHTKYQELLAYTEALEKKLRDNSIDLPPHRTASHLEEDNILSVIEKENRQKHLHHHQSH